MQVNNSKKNNHLLTWIIQQSKYIKYNHNIYTLKSVLDTGLFYQILKNIDQQYFGSFNPQEQNMQDIFKIIDEYLLKECGKRLKITYRNKIIYCQCIQDMVKILLFCCLHSKNKQQYISRIFQLNQEIQATLMDVIQYININIVNVNHNDVMLRVEQLQNQIQELKNEICTACIKQKNSKKIIQQLQEQLSKRNKQIKQYKAEKQKVMQTLDLPNFQQYIGLLQRIQQQNRMLNRYVQQLQDSNQQLQKSQRQLTKNIQNQSIVIIDLSDNITNLKQKISTLKLQASTYSNHNIRSFGVQITNKQNFITSKKRNKKIDSLEYLEQSSPGSFKYNERQTQLLDQMKELRQYNADLLQKIQTVYKTLNNYTQELSQIKQKNQILKRQNKFYRKQINSLKKLQQKMEIDLSNGII